MYFEYTAPVHFLLVFPMNYLILKTVIDSTLQNYNTNNPTAKVSENNIYIVSLAQKGIDLMIHCPHTGKKIQVHAEINMMNNLMQTSQTPIVSSIHINDDDVIAVHKALQKNTNIADLLGE